MGRLALALAMGGIPSGGPRNALQGLSAAPLPGLRPSGLLNSLAMLPLVVWLMLHEGSESPAANL